MRLAPRWFGPALLGLALLPVLAPAQPASPRPAVAPMSAPMSAPVAAPIPASVHEQQLQAIRQALIDATLQAPTQVIASSWLDDMGALRESHQFNSKAEVRSVRLLGLDSAEPKTAAPRASADVLPWGWRNDPQAQNSCSPAPRAWRSPLVLSLQRAVGFPGPQQSASQALLQATRAQVQQALQQGSRWNARNSAVQERNSYLQALSAPARDDTAAWQLDIRLEPQGMVSRAPDTTTVSDGSGEGRWAGGQLWVWVLRLTLAQNSGTAQGNSTSWQQEFRITVDADKLAEHPGQWRAPIEAALAPRVAAWLTGIERQLQCEPVQYMVRSQTGGVLQLMAGAGSGLRPGDRVLIMQPGWVPSRMLDPRAADHLALAEVVQLSGGHTDIRQLAGPPLPLGSDWVALPL